MLPGLPGPLCILPYPRPGFTLFWSCPHSINVEVGRWCGPPLPGFVLDKSQERNRQDKRDVGKSCCRLEAHASIWYEVICCRHGSITVYALFLPSSRRFLSVSPGFPLELCLCVFFRFENEAHLLRLLQRSVEGVAWATSPFWMYFSSRACLPFCMGKVNTKNCM